MAATGAEEPGSAGAEGKSEDMDAEEQGFTLVKKHNKKRAHGQERRSSGGDPEKEKLPKRRGRFDVLAEEGDANETLGELPPGQAERESPAVSASGSGEPEHPSGSTQGGEPVGAGAEDGESSP